jgi:hypothetical protein
VERLALDGAVRLVPTPRHATVLVVAGEVPPEARIALARIHDHMPHPRATLWWRGAERLRTGRTIGGHAATAARAVSDRAEALRSGAAESEADLLSNTPPNPWDGLGDHGQGGEGMMGGVPYGRPMAMTADDIRDGLALDAYTARLGPFLPAFPPGLVLDVTLQGDVIQSLAVAGAPFAQDDLADAPALAAARMLRLLDLPAQAERLVRAKLTGEAAAASRAARAARHAGALIAIPKGLGELGDGTDARERLRRWLSAADEAASDEAESVDLHALLPGREWHEAMIVLASLGMTQVAGSVAAEAAAVQGTGARS